MKSIQENTPESQQQAVEIFRRHGGVLRTMQAVRLGVHPRTLYAMRDNGTLEQLSRGLYRLADLPPLGTPDLVAVAKRVPSGVICLISALSLHELTTEIPHEIYVAIARGAETPRLEHPPLRVFRFSGAALSDLRRTRARLRHRRWQHRTGRIDEQTLADAERSVFEHLRQGHTLGLRRRLSQQTGDRERATTSSGNRVNRGSYQNPARNARAANRNHNAPAIRNNNLGVRPAKRS